MVRFLLVPIFCIASTLFASDGHWVATWGCAPQLTEPGNLPPIPLADRTLRQFARVTVGGKQLRIRFSNTFGTNSVAIRSAHIALAPASASAHGGVIDANTDKMLTFHGTQSVTISAGEDIWSDPLDFDLPALANLSVSIQFGKISATTVTGHPGSRTTSFIGTGDMVSAPTMADAAKTPHWYIFSGVDVLADDAGKAIVALGDSITDGRGSTTDGNNRWPDDFGQRLATNAPTSSMGVVNVGIGGNAIFGGLGPAAVKRFDRDVLGQSGVQWVIVFEGVNDVGGSKGNAASTLVTNLTSAYAQFAAKAHARGLRAYGATITPLCGSFYYTPEHECMRQQVNAWWRTNTVYDAVIDFDAMVRDPMTLTNLSTAYDSGDHLHLSPAGYQAMANGIDLKLFMH